MRNDYSHAKAVLMTLLHLLRISTAGAEHRSSNSVRKGIKKMLKRNAHGTKRLRMSILVCVFTFIFTAVALVPVNVDAGVKTYNQKGSALKDYNTSKYKVVKNKNIGVKKFKKYDVYDVGDTEPHVLTPYKSTVPVDVQTWVYLPKNFQRAGDMGNPQSLNVTPDGRYAYVVYPKMKDQNKKENICRIIRYDLKGLAELEVNVPGNMDDLRWTVNQVFKGKTLDERQKAIYACVKVGPWIKMGHGAAVGYNPKDKHLWFTTKTGAYKTDLQRINMKTFKPDYKINFKMSSYVSMGNNLTFDKKGNCYFYSYSGGSSWAPRGTIKIYRGKINLKKKKKVRFNLVMTGIRNKVSNGIQSIGYNPKENRLYLAADSALISVPVTKLNNKKMTKSDVRSVIFKENREFEGISFDSAGNGYLLVNKQPELMQISGL